MTICCSAACLLDDKAHRVGLVHEPQLAQFVWFALVAWVQKDAAARQNAMHIGHHRGDPAHVEILATRPSFAQQKLVDVALHGRFPVPHIAHVDREFLRLLRDHHV